MRGARDGQPGDVQRQRDRAAEQRRDGWVVPALDQLEQLATREGRLGIELRHHVLLRRRPKRELDAARDVHLALEAEAVQPAHGDGFARSAHGERRLRRGAAQPQRQADRALAPLRQEPRLGQPLQFEPRHRHVGLDRPLQRPAQVTRLAQSAQQIERRQRRDPQRRRALQRDVAVKGQLALLEEQAGPRVDLLDDLGSQAVRLEREGGARLPQRAGGDEVRANKTAQPLVLRGGNLRGGGERRQIDLVELGFELDGRALGLLRELQRRHLAVEAEAQQAGRRDPAVGLEPARVQGRVRLPVEAQIARRPRARAVDVRAHIDVGLLLRPLHHGVGVDHAVQAEIPCQREEGKMIELEARQHHRRVDARRLPRGLRPQLRREAQPAVIADQLERLDDHLVAEVDVGIVGEVERIAGVRDDEVGEDETVLVVVDPRVARQLQRAAPHAGVDAHVGDGPLEAHVDARRAQIDAGRDEPLPGNLQRSVRLGQRSDQRALHGEAVGRQRRPPAQVRRAQAHARVGPGRRSGDVRRELHRP